MSLCWCGQDARLTHAHAEGSTFRDVVTGVPALDVEALLEKALGLLVDARDRDGGCSCANCVPLASFLASPEVAAFRRRGTP